MTPNHQALDRAEIKRERAVTEQSKETLVEEQNHVERVDHANGALADRGHQWMLDAVLLQQFQRHHALVNQVNHEIACGQATVRALFQLVGVEDANFVALGAKIVLAQLELAIGAHAAPIHDGDARFAQAAPGAICGQEFSQDARARGERGDMEAPAEILKERKLTEDGAERFAESQAAGAFSVVFDEVEYRELTGCRRRASEIERVQATAVIAGAARGFERQQSIFLTANAQAGAQGVVGQQVIVSLAQCAAQNGRDFDQVAVLVRRQEMGAQDGTDRSRAEVKPISLQRGLELLPRRQWIGGQKFVPGVNRGVHGAPCACASWRFTPHVSPKAHPSAAAHRRSAPALWR